MPRTARPRKETFDDLVEVIEPVRKYLCTKEDRGLRFIIHTIEEEAGAPPSDGRWSIRCEPIDPDEKCWKAPWISGLFHDPKAGMRSLRKEMLTGKE
jgi:hypothetical protein